MAPLFSADCLNFTNPHVGHYFSGNKKSNKVTLFPSGSCEVVNAYEGFPLIGDPSTLSWIECVISNASRGSLFASNTVDDLSQSNPMNTTQIGYIIKCSCLSIVYDTHLLNHLFSPMPHQILLWQAQLDPSHLTKDIFYCMEKDFHLQRIILLSYREALAYILQSHCPSSF